jgi:hypothetical protein
VIDYVDYSSPVTTYATKGGFTQYPTKWAKTETKSIKNDFDNLANWGWGNDDYCDPFYWSNTSSPNTSVSAWNIIDSAKDFVVENRTDISSLKELRDDLYDFLADLEILLVEEAILN